MQNPMYCCDMSRVEIRNLVSNISPLDELEKTHIQDVLDWIDLGVELCRLEKPATPPKHLVSYFALYDSEAKKILLVDHKKSGLWLPAGGHVDPGEHPKETANRELKEELNIELPLLFEQPIFLTSTETVGLTAGHIDVSFWYVFKADSNQELKFDEREFKAIKWFALNNLPTERVEPHLQRFVRKLL